MPTNTAAIRPLTALMRTTLAKLAAEIDASTDHWVYAPATRTLGSLESRGLVKLMPNRSGGFDPRVSVTGQGRAALADASKPAAAKPMVPVMEAAPHVAKSGSGRILARVSRGAGFKGCVVRLEGALVKLHNRVDVSETDEVWSHAALTPAESAQVEPAPARRMPSNHDVAVALRAHRDNAPSPEGADQVAPLISMRIKPSPLQRDVADLVAGYSSDADDRADNEEHPDAERKAARLVSRMFHKLSVDIAAGRVEIRV